MSKQGQVGVYKLYKLGRAAGNKFTDEFKSLERDVHVVNHNYVEHINRYSVINGLQYEFCEKESKLYWEKKPFKAQKEYTEFEEVEKEAISEDESIAKIAEDDFNYYKEDYFKLSGKKAHHLWKQDKLIEEIEKLKN